MLNNDPETKKILLEVHWRNTSRKEQIILGYESRELRNFHLLNSYEKKEEDEENGEGDEGGEHDIAELQKRINKAIEDEDYETAATNKQLTEIVNKNHTVIRVSAVKGNLVKKKK